MGGSVAVPVQQEGFKHLLDPNRKWYNNRRLIALHGWLVLMLITSSTSGYDGSIVNSLQSMYQWENFFGNPEGGTLGLLTAIQNIGSLAGLPFAPYLSDGIGRRPTIWIGATIMLVGAALQTACTNINQFIGARFLIGFGLTFAANAAPMLITELCYPLYRPQLSSVYNTLWASGNIIASWTAFGTAFIKNDWSWRIVSLLQATPSFFQFFLIWFVPESPRYLVSKGKNAQALRTLAYYHADGDESDPLVLYEFEEIKTAISMDKAAKNVGYLSLIKTKGNRKRMGIIIAIAWFSQWSGNGLVSYYLNKVFDTIGITDTTIQLLITGILAIWNLVVGVTAAFQVERYGRRRMFVLSAAGMTLFFTLQTICSARYAITGDKAAAHAVIAFIFLYYAAYDIAFLPLLVSYTIEILPYSIRAKGLNVSSFTISLALIFNQYVNPTALSKIGWKYYLVYCVWLVFETAIVYFFIVETKGKTLEETAALFDGEDAAIHSAAAHAATADVRQEDYEEKSADTEADTGIKV